MSMVRRFLKRYWSLAAAILLPVIKVLSGEFISNELLSVICATLLVHSWFMQRKYAKSKWRLVFLTLLLSLIMLGPIWLGMNVIRADSYPSNWKNDVDRYFYICNMQDRVVQLAEVLGIAVVLWVIVDLGRWLVKRSFKKLP
jgi:hypothetical protein